MAVFKCKICGATLDIKKDENIVECGYCGTKQTVPVIKTKEIEELYDRANYFFHNNEYDKAADIYETISTENPYDPESYFMLALCKYGIEYVEDPKTKKRMPTLHRLHYESILNDVNFKKALKHADSTQKILYEQEAKYIDEVRSKILDISKKEKPYDVFICYKETDEKGQRTEDSVLAMDIYNELTKEGLKVFFSRITLENKLGVDYEPYIFAALNSAKVMVVVGTKPEYINSPWVRNEWTRFLDRINKNKASKNNKENCYIVPAYKGMSPYALPNEFSSVQAQDMSKVGATQDLVNGVKKLLNKTKTIKDVNVRINKKMGKIVTICIVLLIIICIVLMINVIKIFSVNKKILIRDKEYNANETYTTLSLQGITDFGEIDVLQLKKIKSIKNLYFIDCVLENLDFLSELDNVSGVQFNESTKVMNCDLNTDCESIETFVIDASEKNLWDNIEVLKNMPNLIEIYVPICADLTPISNHNKLRSIELYTYDQSSTIVIDNFLWCEGLENVKKLLFYGNYHDYMRNDDLFKGIEALINVEDLQIYGHSIDGEPYLIQKDFYYFEKLKNIKNLELNFTGTYTKSKTDSKNDLDLASLQKMRDLEFLRINTQNNFDLEGLKSLKNIKSIELEGDVLNDDLLCLVDLDTLETLSLRIKGRQESSAATNKRDFSLKGIEGLKNLKMVVIKLEYAFDKNINILDEDLIKNNKSLNYQVIEN